MNYTWPIKLSWKFPYVCSHLYNGNIILHVLRGLPSNQLGSSRSYDHLFQLLAIEQSWSFSCHLRLVVFNRPERVSKIHIRTQNWSFWLSAAYAKIVLSQTLNLHLIFDAKPKMTFSINQLCSFQYEYASDYFYW